MSAEGELISAIHAKNPARVRQAIENGASLTQLDGFGNSPLVEAVQCNLLEIVPDLCTTESINIPTMTGMTPLLIAMFTRKTKFVDVLLTQEGIDVNKADIHHGNTPLGMAAQHGYLEITKVLLKKRDIDVNLENRKGETPLFIAALFQRSDVVNALIGAGADVNKSDIYGRSPLFFVGNYEDKSYEITRLLLRHGANPNVRYNNRTPLHEFIIRDYAQHACMLIAAGANLYEMNEPHNPIIEDVLKQRCTNFFHMSSVGYRTVALLYVALDDYDLSMHSIQRVEDELGEHEMLKSLREKLNNEEIVKNVKKQLIDEKVEWVMHDLNGQNRIVDVVTAMKPLKWPTLVIIEMLMFDNPRLTEVPLHVVWNQIERIIRFKFHKE